MVTICLPRARLELSSSPSTFMPKLLLCSALQLSLRASELLLQPAVSCGFRFDEVRFDKSSPPA